MGETTDEALLRSLPQAEAWSLIAGQVGTGFVFAGIAFFALTVVAWVLQPKRPVLAKVGNTLFSLGIVALFGAFGCLMALFIRDQFQYQYVYGRADAGTALHFKIAGVWAGQQGSFLLWACASALFGLLALFRTGPYMRWYVITFGLFLGAICGILAYETPFNLMKEVQAHGVVYVPERGVGLNPQLQNNWVIIHPPVIFLGFGALTVMFAYAVSAMLTRDLKQWIPMVRGWANLAVALLGFGIILGGFWAYETLGWGGFWAWDPVENVSFVPWLVAVAFLHGCIVQTTRSRWHGANLLLAGIPFLLFVYGTFLVRSGYLADVSVHSFARMDESALKILLTFFFTSLATFLGLYFWIGRPLAKACDAQGETSGLERENAYRFSTLILCMGAVIIAIGMSWPVIMALSGQTVAIVEEQLYHKVLVYFFVPLMLLMAVGPFLSWRTMGAKEFWKRISGVVCLTVFLLGLITWGFRNPTWGVHARPDATVSFPFGYEAPLMPWMVYLTGLCLVVVVANIWRIVEVVRRAPMSVGGFVSHLGFATLLAGLIVSRGFEQKAELAIHPDRAERALDYVIAYKGMQGRDMYDRDGKVLFHVIGARDAFTATPGLYYYTGADGSDKAMVWPHIHREVSHDVYLVMGEPQIFVWQEPLWFKPGEAKTEKGITVKFLQPTQEGEPGKAGTKFGALVDITIEGKTYRANPHFEIGVGPNIDAISQDLAITMPMMDARDGSVALQMLFAKPIYPINLYYKPMTILVWIGTGILLLGGIIASIYRRFRPALPDVPLIGLEETPSEHKDQSHAPVSVA